MLNPRVFIPFLDVLFILIIVFIVLPHEIDQEKTSDVSAGNLIIELTWDAEVDVDVDLWVKSPGQRPIGYSNKHSTHLNLLRDDLGHTNDESKVNYEMVLSRAAPSGEYIITAHLYGLKGEPLPIKIHLAVIGVGVGNGGWSKRIIAKRFELTYNGQELMLARFTYDAEGIRVVSHNPIVRLIREGKDNDG